MEGKEVNEDNGGRRAEEGGMFLLKGEEEKR